MRDRVLKGNWFKGEDQVKCSVLLALLSDLDLPDGGSWEYRRNGGMPLRYSHFWQHGGGVKPVVD
jgi:hypothetical protein